MNSSHARRAAALAAGLLAAFAADAQLFKCVTKEGKTVYQDSKCDEAAKESTVRAPTPGPVAAPAAAPKSGAPAAAAPPAQAGNAVETVAGFNVCAEKVPNFAYKYTAAFEAWKARNADAMTRLSAEPDASRLDERMRAERERAAAGSIAERCADVATSIQPPRNAGAPKVVQ